MVHGIARLDDVRPIVGTKTAVLWCSDSAYTCTATLQHERTLSGKQICPAAGPRQLIFEQ